MATSEATELARRANGPMQLAMADAAARLGVVIRAIADEAIAELAGRPDVIEALKAPAADFVFLEETIDMRISEADLGDEDGAAYRAALGLVCVWLNEQHEIDPPAWFVRDTECFR